MNFMSQIIGIFTLNKNTFNEISEAENLTRRSLLLLILSSLFAGLFISYIYLIKPGMTNRDFYLALIVPTLFCLIYGLDLVWIEHALKKGYRRSDFFTLNKWEGLKDPDFRRGIRLLGYSSVVLWISVIVFFTNIQFYQLQILNSPFTPFFFPFLMFFSPFHYPIVLFLIWQTIVFIYGYNVSMKERDNLHVKGFILGFIVFTIFWMLFVILIGLAILFLYGLFTGGITLGWPKKKKDK